MDETGIGINRRRFVQSLAAAIPATAFLPPFAASAAAKLDETVPCRAITRGPKFHWFAYYDKLQFDPTGRLVLSNEVEFEHRSPTAEDVIKVGMIDTGDNDRWVELGESRAWNWQQGCMLQWLPPVQQFTANGGMLPRSDAEVIWNDREGDQFVCHIVNANSGKQRTLPNPVYALSPSGQWAITTDFRRLNDCRPGYGYTGIPDPNRDVSVPADAGIWRMDLKTGKTKLLLSFEEVAKIAPPSGYSPGAKHWFNHLLVAPDGKRFTFLHRWRGEAEGRSWKTRMFTANADGSGLHLLIPSGKVSHFIWRDPKHILAYAGYGPEAKTWRFQVFEDETDRSEVVEGMLEVDGHCTYLPGNRWILCDTYPNKERDQHLYLLELASRERHTLGHFRLPPEYSGEWRCDLHPRSSPDGRFVTIDSPHNGGRQVYLLDVGRVI